MAVQVSGMETVRPLACGLRGSTEHTQFINCSGHWREGTAVLTRAAGQEPWWAVDGARGKYPKQGQPRPALGVGHALALTATSSAIAGF